LLEVRVRNGSGPTSVNARRGRRSWLLVTVFNYFSFFRDIVVNATGFHYIVDVLGGVKRLGSISSSHMGLNIPNQVVVKQVAVRWNSSHKEKNGLI
jgi:hypothetical protein